MRSISVHESLHDVRRHESPVVDNECRFACTIVRLNLAQFDCKRLDRFLPTDLFPLTLAAFADAFHWALDAIWIIEDFQTSLPSSAQCSAIHGMKRVAFDLVRFVFAGSHDDPAAGRAHSAGARLPVVDARDELIVGDQRRDELFFRMPTGG